MGVRSFRVRLRAVLVVAALAAAALEVARSVPGVMRVENRVNVAGAERPGED